MKRLLFVCCSVTLLASNAGSQDEPVRSEDARLERLFKDYLDVENKLHPLDATRLGDHRYDDRLDDLSAQARQTARERTKQTLESLPKTIDYKKLSRSGQVDFEIWQHQLKTDLWLAENHDPFREDPRVYNDYITESVYLLLTQSTEPAPINVRNCVSRMAAIPRIVQAAKDNLRNPPKVIVETAIKQNRGAISFYESGIFAIAGENPIQSELRPSAQKLVPILKEYQKFLEEDLLPRSNGDWRIGKEKFAKKLELVLNAGLTSEQVLREAETEAVRVEAEMYVIARQLWNKHFPRKAIPQDDETGRRETIRIVLDKINQEHGQAENLVKDIQATAVKIKDFIKARDILKLPNPDRLQIIEMPEFQRGNSIAFLNPAPPLDPQAASFYDISPPPGHWDKKRHNSFLEEYNRHMLQILTIHEAYPGHYVQLEFANRNPSLIRKVLASGVYIEGWAVYTEQVMLDEGLGEGDLALRLSQLKWYLRAVCNAILDYRMHCTGMTDEEALHLLVIRAFQSEAEAILKIIRAKQGSCQLSTYFVGRTAMQHLRRQVQREQGEDFQLGRYHEAMLETGSVPVKYLPELVRERLKRPR